MEKAFQTLEGLIRRSVAPSVTLFVFGALVDYVLAGLAGRSAAESYGSVLRDLQEVFSDSSGVFALAVLLLVLGVSYTLTALQQILFDNRLKESFDPGPRWGWVRRVVELLPLRTIRSSIESEHRALQELRSRVLERVRSEPALAGHQKLEIESDYLLYEILGGIDSIDTGPFVDSAKAIGITAISMILSLLGGLVVYWQSLPRIAVVLILLLAGLCYWFGREATLAQYRARALRLYVNFLMMPSERIRSRLLYPEGAPVEVVGPAEGARGEEGK